MTTEARKSLRDVSWLFLLACLGLALISAVFGRLAHGDLAVNSQPLLINGVPPAEVYVDEFTSPEVYQATWRMTPGGPLKYISCDGRFGGYPCVCRPTGQVQYYNPQTGEPLDLGFPASEAIVLVNGTGIQIAQATIRQDPADFNGDEIVNVEDIYMYLEFYFEGRTLWTPLDFFKAWFDGAPS